MGTSGDTMDPLARLLATLDVEVTVNARNLVTSDLNIKGMTVLRDETLCTMYGRSGPKGDVAAHFFEEGEVRGLRSNVLISGPQASQIRRKVERFFPELDVYKVNKVFIFVILLVGTVGADIGPECRQDGQKLLCRVGRVQDKIIERAEIQFVHKSTEFEALVNICNILDEVGGHQEARKYDDRDEAMDHGSVPIRTCLNLLHQNNQTLPTLSPALEHYLRVEGTHEELIWVQTEPGLRFPDPVPLKFSHRLELNLRWLKSVGTADQTIETIGYTSKTHHWEIDGRLGISDCIEAMLMRNVTHIELRHTDSNTYSCHGYDCNIVTCRRNMAVNTFIIATATENLFGGLLHMPVTPGLTPPVLAKTCKFSFLNEGHKLSLTDHQEMFIAVKIRNNDMVRCAITVSTNPTHGEAESFGERHRCIGLRRRPNSPPRHEACIAADLLINTPLYVSNRRRRGWGSIFSAVTRFSGTATQFGSRAAAAAATRAAATGGQVAAGAGTVAIYGTQGLAHTASMVSVRSTSVVAKSVRRGWQGIKKAFSSTTGKLIMLDVALGVALATPAVILTEQRFSELDQQTQRLADYLETSYNATADRLNEVVNYTTRINVLEPTYELVHDNFTLPVLRPGEAIRRRIEYPERVRDFLPHKSSASFAEIAAYKEMLWDRLSYYIAQAELLHKVLAGEVLLPGLSRTLGPDEHVVTHMLEDRAQQLKIQPGGDYKHEGEVLIDLRPDYGNGWLHRLRTQRLEGNRDACRPLPGGQINNPWCYIATKSAFSWEVQLRNSSIHTIFNEPVSILCFDGTKQLESGRYTVVQVPTGCKVLAGQQYAGTDSLTGSLRDIHVYTETPVHQLPAALEYYSTLPEKDSVEDMEPHPKAEPPPEESNPRSPEEIDERDRPASIKPRSNLPVWILYSIAGICVLLLLIISSLLALGTDCMFRCCQTGSFLIRQKITRRQQRKERNQRRRNLERYTLQLRKKSEQTEPALPIE